MKITKTHPENKAFFNEHGSSLATYRLIGFIGQLLSGLSLAYAVYALILAQILKQGLAGKKAPLLAVALVVAIFIELANRVLARRAIKPFVLKELFWEDPELARRHRILNRSYLVGLVGIAALSYFLSAVGSTYYAEDSTRPAALIDQDSLKEMYTLQLDKLEHAFSRDSATLVEPYRIRMQAMRDRFLADSLALRKEREKYRPCATAGNQWCKNKRTEYLARIDRAKAAMNDSIAIIASLKGNALQTALNDRNAKAGNIEKEKTATLLQAREKNEHLLKEKTGDAHFKGWVFIILTIAGQTVFYLMIYLSLQVETGSEIQYEIEPNEFWHLPSILDELRVMIAWRLERGLRRSIRSLFGEPGGHETAIPYRSLFETTNTKGTTNVNGAGSLSKNHDEQENTHQATTAPPSAQNTSKVRGPFTAHEKTTNLADLKQRLRRHKKRLGSHLQKKRQLEAKGEPVPKRTLKAIQNNREWVDWYTNQIETLTSTNGTLQH